MHYGNKKKQKFSEGVRLTDQRGSDAFTCRPSPFTIHVRHFLPTFDIDVIVYYVFSSCKYTENAGVENAEPSSGAYSGFQVRWSGKKESRERKSLVGSKSKAPVGSLGDGSTKHEFLPAR